MRLDTIRHDTYSCIVSQYLYLTYLRYICLRICTNVVYCSIVLYVLFSSKSFLLLKRNKVQNTLTHVLDYVFLLYWNTVTSSSELLDPVQHSPFIKFHWDEKRDRKLNEPNMSEGIFQKTCPNCPFLSVLKERQNSSLVEIFTFFGNYRLLTLDHSVFCALRLSVCFDLCVNVKTLIPGKITSDFKYLLTWLDKRAIL